MAIELDHWSYSCLKLAGECPRSWYGHYVEGIPTVPTYGMKYGQLVHTAMEEYSVACIRAGRSASPRSAEDIAAAQLDAGVASLVRRFPDRVTFDPSLVLADGEGVERAFSFVLPGNTYTVEGRIDRIDWDVEKLSAVVTDYKSGRYLNRPNETPQQLRIYGMAAKAMLPDARRIVMRNLYLSDGRDIEYEMLARAKDLEGGWLVAWIDSVANRTDFPAEGGSWCCSCAQLSECARGKALLRVGVLDSSLEDAQATAEAALCSELAAATLRARLDKWRREAGVDVRVGDRERTDSYPAWAEKGEVRLVPKAGADVLRILEIAIEQGVDPSTLVSTWNGKALGALAGPGGAEDNPWEGEEAKGLTKELKKMLEPAKIAARAAWRVVKDVDDDEDITEEAEEQ